METAPPPAQTVFFLTKLLDHIVKAHISYDKAFKITARRYGAPKWLYGTFYKLGYYVTLYYYGLRWVSGVHGYGVKPAGMISFFQSIGFSVRRLLRIIDREASKLGMVKRISIKYSFPEYVVRDLIRFMPLNELERYLEKLNERRVWLRVNISRTSVKEALRCLDECGVKYRVDRSLEYMVLIEVPKWFEPGKNECVRRGLFTPQDIASAWVVEALVRAGSGRTLLDACSAPGVKLGLTLMRDPGLERIVAVDLSRRRVRYIPRLLRFQGVVKPTILVLNADSSLMSYRQEFDKGLVDAPCSGLGAVSGDPAVKISAERRSKLEHYHSLQVSILERVLEHARRVVYAVCSIHPMEGEEVVEEVVSRGLAEVVDVGLELPRAYRGYSVSKETYRTYPHKMLSQGFYIAVLEARRR